MQRNKNEIIYMVEIGKTIVSFELFEQLFCCDLGVCKGECCIEGDAGAPLELDEVAELERILPDVWDDLQPQCKEVIEKQGVAYCDEDGDMVTSIVDGGECVFTYIDKEDGTCKCVIEKAYREGRIDFYKPISCHLYPVRLAEYSQFTAVNYHRWQICSCAENLGSKLKLPVYKFLKTPLIRKFGEEWYKELEQAAKDYESTFGNISE